MIQRLNAVLTSVLLILIAGCSSLAPKSSEHPPIVFVHGNGDTAAVWQTTAWRFESNGWPRERLFALDAPYPLARAEDDKPQEGRTGTAEHLQQLTEEVARVRRLTGADRVVLIGSSRGGNAIRNYIRNGGAMSVSHAILAGTPNHGVWVGSFLPNSEFNGSGPFLSALNVPQGPDGLEVTAGVKFMTLRSDSQDKFTQPDGRWIGQPNMKTGVTHDSPALRGAENVVLPGRDHREVAFHPDAFAHMFRFITGAAPKATAITAETTVRLNGKINGFRGNDPTNLPIAGAALEIYAVSVQTGQRLGDAVHRRTVGADGLWGPFTAKPDTAYEFVIRADGHAITHIYRSPFPRSSDLIHLRPARLAESERSVGSVVSMSRPRGYFGVGRDRMSLDGIDPPPGIPAGVPGLAVSKLVIKESADRAVVAEFNGERIAVRSWPARENHVVIAEFHY